MRMKKLAMTIACFALLILTVTGAGASVVQITLSSSSTGSVVFTGTGGNPPITFAFNGTCGIAFHCISGHALLEPVGVLGTYQIWMAGSSESLFGGPSDYTVGMTSPLWMSVTFAGSTLLTQLTLVDAFGGTGNAPSFEGTFANSALLDLFLDSRTASAERLTSPLSSRLGRPPSRRWAAANTSMASFPAERLFLTSPSRRAWPCWGPEFWAWRAPFAVG